MIILHKINLTPNPLSFIRRGGRKRSNIFNFNLKIYAKI